MPSLIQLSYALKLSELRHFGQAAEACGVTQPTLSQQLQKLEDEIGLILFDRTKKPILATPEGALYLKQARQLLVEHERLDALARQVRSRDQYSGQFKLAVIPTVAKDLLPLMIGRFSKQYPRVTLFIEETKTDRIIEQLALDQIDGAILATPLPVQDLHVVPLYYESFFAYFSPGHVLAKKSHVKKEDLDASELWMLQDGHCFKDQVLQFCSLKKSGNSDSPVSPAQGNVFFQSGSLDTLRSLVRLHQGFTLLPELMVSSLPKREVDEQVRPFKRPAPAREVSLVYRRGHWKLNLLKAIQTAVEQSLPSGMARRPGKDIQVFEVC